MSKEEIYWTPIGEMMDMLSCLSVYEGGAKPKKGKMSFNDFMNIED